MLLATDLSECRRTVPAVKRQRGGSWRAAGAGRVLGGGTGLVACHDVILARTGRDPPHTRQSSRTLAAFRPWGIWRDKRRARGLQVSLAGRVLSCGRSRASAAPVSCPAEDSPSGLGRTLGKRVGGNPSGVRISYPPPPLTCGDALRSHSRAALHRRRVSHFLSQFESWPYALFR